MQRVRPGCLRDRNRHCRQFAQVTQDGVVIDTQLDARHIAQAGDLTVAGRLDDDLAELFFTAQAAIGIDQQLLVDARCDGRCTHDTCSHLHVLLTDGADHITCGHTTAGDALRIQPHAHGIAATAKDLYAAHAGYAGQRVAHLQLGEVAQVFEVIAPVGRDHLHKQRDVGVTLDRRHTDAAHIFG